MAKGSIIFCIGCWFYIRKYLFSHLANIFSNFPDHFNEVRNVKIQPICICCNVCNGVCICTGFICWRP
jgi:hypothetical protein